MTNRMLQLSALAAALVLTSCTLTSPAAPTPFTFPTPNLTHTAIFAATATDTPIPPTLPPLQATETPVVQGASVTPPTAQPPTATPIAVGENTRPNGAPVAASRLASPPEIDGQLSDWTTSPTVADQTAPYAGSGWTGTSDLSATFYLGWDESYLYLGVRRIDDTVVQISSGRYMYRGDDVEIQLDADLMGDFNSASMSSDDFQIGLSPGNFGGLPEEAYLWFPRNLEQRLTSVTVAARKTDQGYDLEARIPWSVFGVSPTAGAHYGFALSMSDNDVAGASTWQSMVSNVDTRRVADPTTWGTLILEP